MTMANNRALLSAASRRLRLRSLPSSSSPLARPSMSHTSYASSWASTNQSFYTHPTRTFATSRHPKAQPKKNKKGKPDAFKQQLKAQSQSIIGKKPGQTSFSPPKEKVLSTPSKPTIPTKVQSAPKEPKAKPKASTTSITHQTPLVLPPSISQTIQQPLSDHDNKDHAHTQSSASTITQDTNSDNENSPLRDLFLQQGILPPSERPTIDKKSRTNDTTSTIIPESDPSGVSHANPEDILDLASMYDPSIHLPDKPNFTSPANRTKYEAGTPLTDELIAYIGVRGPITVAEFYRRALRDGLHGYYTGKGSREGGSTQRKEKAVSGGVVAGADDAVAVGEQTEMDDDNDWDLDDDDDIHTNNDDSTQQQHAGGEHVIGSGGDFITAPEVSQLFGESLLIWLMTQYRTLNAPSNIQIIEIGPGKGTLICDIVRSAIDTFPDFAAALTTEEGDEEEKKKKKVAIGVHLVEVTNGMRARQKESLENLQNEKAIQEKGYSFQFTDDDGDVADEKMEKESGEQSSSEADGETNKEEQQQQNTINFSWHDVLSSVPTHDAITGKPIPTFIICQELVDALPIHSFQKIEGNVWRERLVDVAIRDDEEASGAAEDVRVAAVVARSRYESAEPAIANTAAAVASPAPTTPSTSSESNKKIPRLRFVLPPDTTPALRTILRVNNKGSPIEENNPMAQSLNSLPIGSIIEACPEGLLLAQDIADRIEKCHGGAALIVDYGGDGSSGGDSLRGFWKHTQVHPLSRPGEVDVTADVDFGALREAVNSRIGLEESLERKRRESGATSTSSSDMTNNNPVEKSNPNKSNATSHRPEAFGPISQGKFLAQMGIVQRVEKKIEDPSTSDEQAEEIYSAMERLMAEDQMGDRYKVLAIAAKKQGLFPPPGF